jgi:hypothetical protein
MIQIPAAGGVAVAAGGVVAAAASEKAPPVASQTTNGHGTSAGPSSPAAAPPPKRPAAPALTPEQFREAVLAAFSGKMTPIKVGIGRKIGALIVLAILFVMPIFYFAVMGALVFAMYWLATTNMPQLATIQNNPAIFWVVEIVAGLFLICLVKPLVEPQRQGVAVYPVDLNKETLLRDFAAKVCEQIDAPAPKGIQFECSTRLAAVNKRGVHLVLGLPVMASLSVEQFAGVVAGQMALHRPKAGCGVMNMIRGINYWLWRSVYGKSRFDRWLSLVAQRRHFHLAKLLLPLMLTKIPAQAVLFVPMFVANTIASSVVRKTEFDADLAATRLVGRKTFTGLLERLEQIDFTWDGAMADLNFLSKEQQLPESLPQNVALRMQDMTVELFHALRETVNAPDEKPFDTKPSTTDRLEAISKEPDSGVVRCGLAARNLLADYDSLSRKMTADFYSGRFGAEGR